MDDDEKLERELAYLKREVRKMFRRMVKHGPKLCLAMYEAGEDTALVDGVAEIVGKLPDPVRFAVLARFTPSPDPLDQLKVLMAEKP